MIVTLISFESIEIVYTETVDLNQHVVVEKNTSGIYTVVK